FLAMRCVSARELVSVPPPGGNGTMKRMGFDGYVCACAIAAAHASATSRIFRMTQAYPEIGVRARFPAIPVAQQRNRALTPISDCLGDYAARLLLQRLGDADSQDRGGALVEDQLDAIRALHGDVRRVLALQDPAGDDPDAAVGLADIQAVSQHRAGVGPLGAVRDQRDAVALGKARGLAPAAREREGRRYF